MNRSFCLGPELSATRKQSCRPTTTRSHSSLQTGFAVTTTTCRKFDFLPVIRAGGLIFLPHLPSNGLDDQSQTQFQDCLRSKSCFSLDWQDRIEPARQEENLVHLRFDSFDHPL